MERETEAITHTAEPAHAEEWRQTEPFDEGPYPAPEDQAAGTPAGMTRSDVNRRADIAVYLPPGKLPAGRDAILDYVRETGAPDDVVEAVSGLPADQEFRTIGEVVRAMGIHTEEPRDRGEG